MINWDNLNELHVISKLEELLNNWFNVEVLYTDIYHKIKSKQINKNYPFKNEFLKSQIETSIKYERFTDDLERISQTLCESTKKPTISSTSVDGVKILASKIIINKEHMGTILAYPFSIQKNLPEEKESLENIIPLKLQDGDSSKKNIKSIKALSLKEVEYLQELVELVVNEIETYHNEISKREERIQILNSELGERFRYHNIIGKSKSMQKIYNFLEKISKSESSILIQGENGTGKELVAKAIHFHSPRKDFLFLAVNCSAFNENLLDSELFGHVKGSFTGATKDHPGLFEMANGGTLFLDEIGDTSPSMQVKLLRVLQEGTYMPVGGNIPKKTNIRIISATNKNLKTMINEKSFREDLYYRIHVLSVTLPPLRERNEDIPILIDHFLKKKCDESGQAIKHFSKKCMEKMLDYVWPGNVRQLENEIERLTVLTGHDKIIAPSVLSSQILNHNQQNFPSIEGINTSGKLKTALQELEIIMIRDGLRKCDFNKSRLAKYLGMSRASLIMKIEKYDLEKRKKSA